MSVSRKFLWIFLFVAALSFVISSMFPPELYRLWVVFKVDALFLIAGLITSKDAALLQSFKKGAVGVWGIWTIYTFVNWALIGLNPDGLFYINKFWGLMRIYCFLAVLYYEASVDFDGAIKRLLIIFSVYAVIGLFIQESELITEGHNEGRIRTTLGNHFPLAMCAFAFVAIVGTVKGLLSKKLMYFVLGLVIFIIFQSATRKCLGAVSILVIFYILSQMKNKSPKTYIMTLVYSLVLYVGYNFVMDNTLIGQRLQSIDDDVYLNTVDIPVYLSFLGDRAYHYVLAWDMFLEHPWNGVGITNFMHLSILGMPPHTEYMTQLCEGGIIGSSLFLLFLYKIFRPLQNSFKINSDHSSLLLCLGGVGMVLFIAFTAWTYSGAHFFVIWALVLAYCDPIQSTYKNHDS